MLISIPGLRKASPVAFLLSIALPLISYGEEKKTISSLPIDASLKWSERMTLSEIHRFPDPTLFDFHRNPHWSYTPGLVLHAICKVHEKTDKQDYLDYVYRYPDKLIKEDGSIKTYQMAHYNLDMIKSGDVIYYLYDRKPEPKFLKVMDTLHEQMEGQPTTTLGGYWHKKKYTHQMWLDGVYMAEPFHTKYARSVVENPELRADIYDKVVRQYDLIEKHTKDKTTGLYYHGWDESREQRWADKKTGLSSNFWSRGMGWYGMALVDVLDDLPKYHEGYGRIVEYLNGFAEAIVKVQDPETGTWYQVVNFPDREGNYLEASGTAMFAYTLAKGVRMGYLPEKYLEHAQKAYDGILEQFITVDKDGVVSLNKCCSVASLGGKPYRDGSFQTYINEKIRANDPKGTGPFIMVSLELDR